MLKYAIYLLTIATFISFVKLVHYGTKKQRTNTRLEAVIFLLLVAITLLFLAIKNI